MANPQFTVLIDTFNQASFIAEALTSVLQQDFPASDMEIIVVDDGSTDGTPGIVTKFQPRVRLITKTNCGQASAFNRGIAEVSGEIVAFLDGDDWWASNKLNCVAQAFARHPAAGVVGHGIIEAFPDGRRRSETLHSEDCFRVDSETSARMFRSRKQFLGTSRMAIRSTLLKEIGNVPESLTFEADEYLFTLAAVLSEVVILPEALTYYRQHSGNLFQVADGNAAKLRRKLQIMDALCAALRGELKKHHVEQLTRTRIMETIENDAARLRLALLGGFPWETLRAELQVMKFHNSEASVAQRLFTYGRLIPALLLPSRVYYRCRNWMVKNNFYSGLRRKVIPVFQPPHVRREEK